jgi:hypothetical protein
MVNNTVYCWWTGESELSDNRKRSLDSMLSCPGGNICFIDKASLSDYILDEHPLHDGYEFLSDIQKGDYLKCYFMHHYGGGYSDIKRAIKPWSEYFEKINNDENLYAIGYKEKNIDGVACLEDCSLNPEKSKFCRNFTLSEDGKAWSSSHIRNNWKKLIGNGCFICKKNTPLTTDWWNALNEKMDGYLDMLKKNPAQWARDSGGHVNPNTKKISQYPIKWAVLHGHIFHPLTLKYYKNINQDLPHPIMENYL